MFSLFKNKKNLQKSQQELKECQLKYHEIQKKLDEKKLDEKEFKNKQYEKELSDLKRKQKLSRGLFENFQRFGNSLDNF